MEVWLPHCCGLVPLLMRSSGPSPGVANHVAEWSFGSSPVKSSMNSNKNLAANKKTLASMFSFQTSLLASIGRKKNLTKSPHKNKQSSNMDETSTVKHLEESNLESPGWGLQGSSWKTRKFSTRKSKSDKDPAVDMEVIITCSCFCVPSVAIEILLFVWFGTIHLHHHDIDIDPTLKYNIMYSNTRRIWREKGGPPCCCYPWESSRQSTWTHGPPPGLKITSLSTQPELDRNESIQLQPLFQFFAWRPWAIALRRQKAALINLGNWNYTIITPK